MRRVHTIAVALATTASALSWPLPVQSQVPTHVTAINVEPSGYLPPTPNAVAPGRRAVIESFYRSHTDSYDFLVAFPAFPTTFGAEAVGLHHAIRNDVTGIGKPFLDNGTLYGAPSRLKAFIDIGSLIPGNVVTTPEDAAGIVAHEVAHQWSGQVRFQSAPWNPISESLLGHDNAHWSFFLNSDASVLYGSQWTSTAAGTFTSAESRRRYSSLDLYLMGFQTADEVEPARLILPGVTAFQATDLPPPDGTQIQGSVQRIDISEIIAAEGVRKPAAEKAQHEFRAAFILLVPSGQAANPDQLAFVDQVRRAWANDFFLLTRGRGVMETDLVEAIAANVAGNPAVSSGLTYLLGQQRADGAWSDAPMTTIRETQEALTTLRYFSTDVRVPGALARAADFLETAVPKTTDERARIVQALNAAGRSSALLPGRWAQDSQGGFVPAIGYSSTVMDSILAGLALERSPTPPGSNITSLIVGLQAKDGGWPFTPAGPSRIEPTAAALEYISRLPTSNAYASDVKAAIGFLRGKRLPDDTYADDINSTASTARSVLALAQWHALVPVQAAGSATQLLARQAPGGSWGESSLQTALALRMLQVALTPDLAIDSGDLAFTRVYATEGEVLQLSATVHNIGYGEADSIAIQVFDSNGSSFGSPTRIDRIRPGDQASATLYLDTTGHAGSQQVFVVVDPAGAIAESRKDNNRVALPLTIAAPPAGVELVAVPGTLVMTPGAVKSLLDPITVSARIDNIGESDVTGVPVALMVQGVAASTTVITCPARSSQIVTLTAPSPRVSGAFTVSVVVDPGNAITETRKDNNALSAKVPIIASVDLAVAAVAMTPASPHQGQDLEIDYQVINNGTADVDNVNFSLTISDARGAVLATLPSVGNVDGGGESRRSVIWRAKSSGTLTVEVRADSPLEDASTIADNVVRKLVTVSPVQLPDLSIAIADVVFSPNPPLQSKEGTVSATVRNTGGGRRGCVLGRFLPGRSRERRDAAEAGRRRKYRGGRYRDPDLRSDSGDSGPSDPHHGGGRRQDRPGNR